MCHVIKVLILSDRDLDATFLQTMKLSQQETQWKTEKTEHLHIQLTASSKREHIPAAREKKSTVLTLYLITQQCDSPSSLSSLQLPAQLFSSRLPSLTMHGLTPPFLTPPLFCSLLLSSFSASAAL